MNRYKGSFLTVLGNKLKFTSKVCIKKLTLCAKLQLSRSNCSAMNKLPIHKSLRKSFYFFPPILYLNSQKYITKNLIYRLEMVSEFEKQWTVCFFFNFSNIVLFLVFLQLSITKFDKLSKRRIDKRIIRCGYFILFKVNFYFPCLNNII